MSNGGVVDEALKSGASILRSFWRKFSGKPQPLPSGVESPVRETDLTKFFQQLLQQAGEEALTLQGTLSDRKSQIEGKLSTKDFDGAEPLLIDFSSALKLAISQKTEWMKVDAEFKQAQAAIEQLMKKWKAPEVLGTGGMQETADKIAKLLEKQDYDGALNEYGGLKREPLSAQELLTLYPDRKLWLALVGDYSQAVSNLEKLATHTAPEHSELAKKLKSIEDKASPTVKDFKGAAAELPELAKRIQTLADLYPGRGEWAALAMSVKRVRRMLNDLTGWTVPEANELSTRLTSIEQDATDKAGKYQDAVNNFKLLEADADLVHRFWSKQQAVARMLNPLLQQQPTNAGELRAAMAMAVQLGEQKKYADSIKVLERLKGLMQVSLASNADLEQLAFHVTTLRANAETNLNGIEAKLREKNNDGASRVADIVKDLAANLPKLLDTKLRELDYETEESAKPGRKTAVKSAAQEWLNFMATHKAALEACAANPFQLPFDLPTAMTATIKTVLQQVA